MLRDYFFKRNGDWHNWVVALVTIGTVIFLMLPVACASLRETNPITVKSTISRDAVRASSAPETTTVVTIRGGDTTKTITIRPRGAMDVVATRDTVGKVTIKSGDTTKVLDIKSSNATVAAADKAIKDKESDNRTTVGVEQARNRWPQGCGIICAVGGAMGSYPYGGIFDGGIFGGGQVILPNGSVYAPLGSTGRNISGCNRVRCW